MNRLASVLLIVLLVSAGCAGQRERQTPTETEKTIETDTEITTEGAPFPVDAGVVFRRVETLLGEELTVPKIRVLRVQPVNRTSAVSTDTFSRRMGIDHRQSMNEVGGNTHKGVVRIFYTGNATATKMEQVLAHEFVHVSQPESLWQQLRVKQGTYSESTDARIVRDAISEGTAAYVANEYTDQYLPETTPQATYSNWDSFTAGTKWHLAPYYFGAEYVRDHLDNASNVDTIYANSPITSEQLLHGYEPTKEPPRNLTIDVKTEDDSWGVEDADTKGELFVRIVLAERLDESQASDAAAGWGNDRVVTFQSENQTLHAWTLRWDDERNATEFENAVRTYLDSRATERDSVWTEEGLRFDLRRTDATTVVLLVGNTSVENVGVAGNSSSVTIRPNTTY